MIDFPTACEKAIQNFTTKGYKEGLVEACNLGDRWLFFGRIFDGNVVEYGNEPIAIDKDNGEIQRFIFSDLDNMDLYYSSPIVKIPSKYLLK